MASSVTTGTPSSSVITTTSSLHMPFQLLEITIISAQDLTPVSKSIKTYAVAWTHSDRKLRSRVDMQGHTNPRWNDKFVFRIDERYLTSDTSAVMVEIYAQAWLRDTLVGTVRVLINNLIPPSVRSLNNTSTRFVALQVRRPSGTPQGILNMGVSLLDTTMRSMPLYMGKGGSAVGSCDNDDKQDGQQHDDDKDDEKKQHINSKIQLWRSRSEGTDLSVDDYAMKGGSVCNGSMVNGSICNGSMVNGSEQYSDVGPSASVVAAAIAKGLYPVPPPSAAKRSLFTLPPQQPHVVVVDDAESSILEDLTYEEAAAKGYRRTKMQSWRKQSSPNLPVADVDDDSLINESSRRHSRRHSDGGGLFSCFGTAYGIEFTIVCGANSNSSSSGSSNNSVGKSKRKKKLATKYTEQNTPLRLPSSRNSD